MTDRTDNRTVLCECHGEPAYWHSEPRRPCGGYFICAVKDRAQKRRHYDSDPIYRIGKNLHDHARRRRQTIQRWKEGGQDGSLPQ